LAGASVTVFSINFTYPTNENNTSFIQLPTKPYLGMSLWKGMFFVFKRAVPYNYWTIARLYHGTIIPYSDSPNLKGSSILFGDRYPACHRKVSPHYVISNRAFESGQR